MVAVNGSEPYSASSLETVREYEQGRAVLVAVGAWYDGIDDTGARKLVLYPPQESAVSVELEYVYRPASMVDAGDEPAWMPAAFHKGLLYSAAAVYFEDVEDNPELAKWNQEKADAVASELRRHDIDRSAGDGVFQIPVTGWTAAR